VSERITFNGQMSRRKIYFGAGPAALPQAVIEATAQAVLDYDGSGISLLSIAHREKAFGAIMEEASALALQLAELRSRDYEVLWLQGGGRQQFAMVPMNFLAGDQQAGYIDSGHWAHEAMEAAGCFGNVLTLASSAADRYRHLPIWPQAVPDSLQYLHLTTNNTIYGTQWPEIPACPVPIVADMSSDIFSMRRDYSRCALIYAVAQKNIGPAGVTLVLLRKDMLSRSARKLPDAMSYAGQVRARSMLNTPPVAAIYTCMLTLRWIAARGIAAIENDNRKKAALVYEEIGRNKLFHSPVDIGSRSMMNVVFTMKDSKLERVFLEYCARRDIEGIKGHRSVGGFRASLYNAVSIEDVEALIQAMQEFEKQF
jgi:phosphoserine aminotransferase